MQSADVDRGLKVGQRVGQIPREVERDTVCRAHQTVDLGAILESLDDRSRLAREREPGKARSTRGECPRWNRDAKPESLIQQAIDQNPAPEELTREVRVVFFDRREFGEIVCGRTRGDCGVGHS